MRLTTGTLMPTIGYGTYLASAEQLQNAVDVALNCGYRHIDTSYSYHNDKDIGLVIADNIRKGKLKRKDVFITTKIPPDNLALGDMRPCVEETLDNLQMSHIDLLLIHAPFTRPNAVGSYFDLSEIWSVFETFFKEGVVKAIGVSNFTVEQLQRISTTASVKPANVQLECHGYFQQRQIREYCNANDIVVTGYSPLATPGVIKGNDNPILLEDPVVKKIAEDLKRTPAQILLRYLLQLQVIPLPKSATPQRIEENIKVYDFEIPTVHMNKLEQLDRNLKFFKFASYANHPEYPKDGEDF